MNRERLIDLHMAALAELGWTPPSGRDWVDQFDAGDVITTDIAAFVGECSMQTVRRWAADAQADGKSVGILIAQTVWLISRRRWLDSIGRPGSPDRVKAEARFAFAKKRKNGRVATKINPDERTATA